MKLANLDLGIAGGRLTAAFGKRDWAVTFRPPSAERTPEQRHSLALANSGWLLGYLREHSPWPHHSRSLGGAVESRRWT